MTTLAQRLKQARLASGKSQTQIANAVGMKQPSYNAIESGKVQRSGFLTDIAQYLGVDPAWLATGQGQINTQGIVVNGNNTNHGTQIGTQYQTNQAQIDGIAYLSVEQQKAVQSLAKMANISPAEWVQKVVEKELTAIRQAVSAV